MHPLTIVGELQAGITDEQRATWLVSDVTAWGVIVGETCQYRAGNCEFDEGEPEKGVVVDDGYLDRHAPIARERIAMAGVRLAGLLNGCWVIRVLSAELLGPMLTLPSVPSLERDLADDPMPTSLQAISGVAPGNTRSQASKSRQHSHASGRGHILPPLLTPVGGPASRGTLSVANIGGVPDPERLESFELLRSLFL